MIHQIGTDGVVLVRRECDLQFGSDAIHAGDQHRLAHPAKIRREESAKPADSSQHLRAVRLADKGLNSTFELVAKVNINAGAGVSFLSLCHVERSETSRSVTLVRERILRLLRMTAKRYDALNSNDESLDYARA